MRTNKYKSRINRPIESFVWDILFLVAIFALLAFGALFAEASDTSSDKLNVTQHGYWSVYDQQGNLLPGGEHATLYKAMQTGCNAGWGEIIPPKYTVICADNNPDTPLSKRVTLHYKAPTAYDNGKPIDSGQKIAYNIYVDGRLDLTTNKTKVEHYWPARDVGRVFELYVTAVVNGIESRPSNKIMLFDIYNSYPANQ